MFGMLIWHTNSAMARSQRRKKISQALGLSSEYLKSLQENKDFAPSCVVALGLLGIAASSVYYAHPHIYKQTYVIGFSAALHISMIILEWLMCI